MISVSICICTRNRKEGLRKLLESIEKLEIPSETNVKIIIVENDYENFCENYVNEFSAKSKFRVNYYLEPRQGLSFARNRSVNEASDCDFCCFVDDDQVVDKSWISEMLRCQKEFNSDGVWGTNPPLFSNIVPSYISQFYQPDSYLYGTIVNKAHTNSLLLRKKILDKLNGPFEIRLNFTGGEDSYLTSLFTDIGGEIRFNPKAIAYEIINEDRLKIKYLLKRTYRISNAGLLVRSLIDKNFSRFELLPRLIMRFFYGIAIFLPFFIFGKENKLKGLLKISNSIGGFAFILGKQNQFYK